MGQSPAALLLESRISERLDALVPGTSGKATRVRLLQPPVEGRSVSAFHRLDVAPDRMRVKLIGTDGERGFIDFSR